MSTKTQERQPVTLTQEAAEKVASYAETMPAGETCLRVAVRGGGCSGFQYALAFDHQHDDDLVFHSHGQTVVVDPASYELVYGSEIVYVDGLMGAGFDVSNPRATSACGCGSSFRVDNGTGCSVDEDATSDDTYL